MTARQFLTVFKPRIAKLARDAEAMPAAAFMGKYGVDVRECRSKLKRLKELAKERQRADNDEARELVTLFVAVCLRNPN